MNTQTTTPPNIKIKNLPYNKWLFERIISRMNTEHISMISIEVWAEDGPNCIEILRSGLSGEEFDAWAAKASRMIFRGPDHQLQSLGVA